MSWLSSAVKKVRKAAGIPPITIGNVVKAIATGGSSVVAQTGGNLVDRAKAAFEGKVDEVATKVQTAKTANDTYDAVKANQMPLIIAGLVAAYVIFHKD